MSQYPPTYTSTVLSILVIILYILLCFYQGQYYDYIIMCVFFTFHKIKDVACLLGTLKLQRGEMLIIFGMVKAKSKAYKG